MDIIQSYYKLSNKNNGVELIRLFNIGLSRSINNLSLISNKNTNKISEPKRWNHQMRSHDYKPKGGHVLNS